eukprot:COSAG02_NODE_36937_length_448_cov_1.401146_2_plen_36_part_01
MTAEHDLPLEELFLMILIFFFSTQTIHKACTACTV